MTAEFDELLAQFEKKHSTSEGSDPTGIVSQFHSLLQEEGATPEQPEEKETNNLKYLGQQLGVGARRTVEGIRETSERHPSPVQGESYEAEFGEGEATRKSGLPTATELRKRWEEQALAGARHEDPKRRAAVERRDKAVEDVQPLEEYLPDEVTAKPSDDDRIIAPVKWAGVLARTAPAMVHTAVDPVGGTAHMAFQMLGEKMDEFEQTNPDLDPDRAYELAWESVAETLPFEQAGNALQFSIFGKILKRGGKWISKGIGTGMTRIAGGMGLGAVGEGTEEFLQEMTGEITNIKADMGEDVSGLEIVLEWFRRSPETAGRAWEAFKQAMGPGAMIPGAAGAIATPRQLLRDRTAKKWRELRRARDEGKATGQETGTESAEEAAPTESGDMFASLREDKDQQVQVTDAAAMSSGAGTTTRQKTAQAQQEAQEQESTRQAAAQLNALRTAEERQAQIEQEDVIRYQHLEKEEAEARARQQSLQERNQAFIDNLQDPEQANRLVQGSILSLELSQDKAAKDVGKTLREAHRAVSLEEKNVEKLRGLAYDLDILNQQTGDPRISAVIEKLQNDLAVTAERAAELQRQEQVRKDYQSRQKAQAPAVDQRKVQSESKKVESIQKREGARRADQTRERLAAFRANEAQAQQRQDSGTRAQVSQKAAEARQRQDESLKKSRTQQHLARVEETSKNAPPRKSAKESAEAFTAEEREIRSDVAAAMNKRLQEAKKRKSENLKKDKAKTDKDIQWERKLSWKVYANRDSAQRQVRKNGLQDTHTVEPYGDRFRIVRKGDVAEAPQKTQSEEKKQQTTDKPRAKKESKETPPAKREEGPEESTEELIAQSRKAQAKAEATTKTKPVAKEKPVAQTDNVTTLDNAPRQPSKKQVAFAKELDELAEKDLDEGLGARDEARITAILGDNWKKKYGTDNVAAAAAEYKRRKGVTDKHTQSAKTMEQRFQEYQRKAALRASKGEGTKGLKAKVIKSTLNKVISKAKGALDTVVVETQDKLPENLRKSLKGDNIEAVYDPDRKKVYLIAENIPTTKRAVQVWMHEQVGHHGLFSLFKNHDMDFKAFLDSVWQNIKTNKETRVVMDEYAGDLTELSTTDQRRLIVEEVLARRAERLNPNIRKTLYQKFRDFVNQWIEKFVPGMKFKSSDINMLLEAAKNHVMQGNVRGWLEFKYTDQQYKEWAEEVRKANPKAVTWYGNHQALVREVFGQDAGIFNALLAITSPEAKVDMNAAWAVQTYLWMHGKVKKPGGKYPWEGTAKKTKQLKKGQKLQSNQVKVDEFLRGLMGDKNATVNDRWMYRVWFGDSMWSRTLFDNPNISFKDLDAKWKVPENTAARFKLNQLSRELSQETGYKWTPNQLQAALWMKFALPAQGKSLAEAYDYQNALNSPIDKWGGKTPLEYLQEKMGDTPIGTLREKYEVNLDRVSLLEKQYLAALDEHGFTDTREVTKPKDLEAYLKELQGNKYAHVLTIPSLDEFKQAVKDGSRVFLTKDGKAGYTLDKDGDIQKVFNNSPVAGVGKALLVDAIYNGGRTLDCFEPYLPRLYAEDFGFQETWRYRFDPEQASDAWDINRHGAHDVVGFELPESTLERFKNTHGKIDKRKIRDALGSFPDYRPGRYSDTGQQGTRDSYPDDFGKDRPERNQSDPGRTGKDEGVSQGTDRVPGLDVSPRLSRKPSRSKVLSKYYGTEPKSAADSVRDTYESILGISREQWKWFKDKVITKSVDYLHPIKVLEERTEHLAENMSAYTSMRLSSTAPQIFSTFLNSGFVKLDPKTNWIAHEKPQEGFEGGLLQALKDLGDEVGDFEGWMLVKRIRELKDRKPEYYETVFGEGVDTETALAEIEAEVNPKHNKKWDKALEHLQAYNKNLLDFAEAAGIIDPEKRSSWESEVYLPLQRVLPDNGFTEDLAGFPISQNKIGSIKSLKDSKGYAIGNPLENLLGNYYYLMGESMRNIGRVKAHNLLQGTGILKTKQVHPQGKRTMTIRVDGKPKYFTVTDPDIYYALVEVQSDWFHQSLKKWISAPKRLITRGVTFRAAFRLANWMRDTMQTIVLHGDVKRAFRSVKAGWDAYRDHPDMVEFAAQGGAFSGTFDNPGDFKRVVKTSRRTKMSWYNPKQWLKFWDDIGTAAENANRLALYREQVQQGKSTAEAALVAKDLMDFSMHGQSMIARGLITLVPFLNARLQGLYKLGRGYKADKAGFRRRAAAMAGLSAALAVWNMTMFAEGWDDLEDYERWTYWHFGPGTDWGWRIPMPFEIGALFGAVPTLAAEFLRKDVKEGAADLGNWLGHFLTETMMFNPIDIAMPGIEVATNTNFYTGRPIVSRAQENVEPGEQYDPWTSDTLKLFGQVTNVSPKKTDHLLTNYFGGYYELGKWMMDRSLVPLAETVGHTEYPEDPALTRRDHWLYGRFAGAEIPRHTRYATEFYDMAAEFETVYSTFLQKQKRGDKRAMRQYRNEHREELKGHKIAQKYRDKLSRIRTRMRQVWYSEKLTKAEKRQRIDKLQQERNALVKKAVERMKR